MINLKKYLQNIGTVEMYNYYLKSPDLYDKYESFLVSFQIIFIFTRSEKYRISEYGILFINIC
jgi:hypothetical protein